MDDFRFFVVLECEVVGEEFPLFVIQGDLISAINSGTLSDKFTFTITALQN